MPKPGIRFVTHPPSLYLRTLLKSTPDDECLHHPQTADSGAGGGSVCGPQSDFVSGADWGAYHCSPCGKGLAPTLARGHGLCFPGFSFERRRPLLARIRPLPSRSDHSGTSPGRNCFHTDVRLVRPQLVLEGLEEKLKRSLQSSAFSPQGWSSAIFDFLTDA